MRALVLSVLLMAVVVACSDGDDGATETVVTSVPTTTSATTVPVTSTPEDTTPDSTALVSIGPAEYALDAICALDEGGDVEVSVSGTDVNGLAVIGYIQAIPGRPYVSLQVGTGAEAVLFEPRLEAVLRFDSGVDGVAFHNVDFVTELDLETGEFVPAGRGSVEVECLTYVGELPPVPFG